MTDRQHLQQLSRRLASDGKLIEAGWVAFRLMVMPPNASAKELDDARFAYMAGAQHLFSSMLDALDAGDDPTPADMRRMDLIAEELLAWAEEAKLRLDQPAGSA